MGRSCEAQEGHGTYAQNFGLKALREENLEDLGADGRIIVKVISHKQCWCKLDYYGSGQDQWHAPMNMVMNLLVP
jgi:hypothetical protein